jgi:hypothetical protein
VDLFKKAFDTQVYDQVEVHGYVTFAVIGSRITLKEALVISKAIRRGEGGTH